MAENFYTMLTILGKNKLSSSAISGSKVNFKTLKVGDGNGAYYEPSENQTSLMNQVWEGNISSISTDENNSNWIVVETVIPASDGGFFIREAGIFDEDGDMIAISKLAETYKPVVTEGSTKDLVIKIVLEVLNVDTITIKIDPNVVAATKNDVQVLEAKIQDVSAQLSEKANQSDLVQLSNSNLLINGDFSQWQRENNFTTGMGYTADRWFVWSTGSPSVTNVGNYALQIVSTGNDNVMQAIPVDAIKNNGTENEMFFSAWITSDSATMSNVILTVSDASGMTSGNSAIIATETFSVNNSMSSFLELSVPAHTYTNGFIKVAISFSDSRCTGKTFTITKTKLEYGDRRTVFIPRRPAEELALCQRYYEESDTYVVGIGSNVNKEIACISPYKVIKRITPTVTIVEQDGTTGYVSKYAEIANKIAVTVSSGNTKSLLSITLANNTVAGDLYTYNYKADAEIY